MAVIKSEHYAYQVEKITCRQCGWTGLGKETKKEFDEHPGGMPYHCPKCNVYFRRVAWPTDEETLKYGPKKKKEQVRQSNIHMAKLKKKWDAAKLKGIKDLPKVTGDSLEFVSRETRDEDNDVVMTVTCGGQLIWKEVVYYEYYQRFMDIGRMLKTKYRARMIDIIPDGGIDLYGDWLSAPKEVDAFRAKLRPPKEDLLRRAKAGNAAAQYALAVSYSTGANKDLKKAFDWWTKAAEQGHSFAQDSLARCYYHGEGVEKDLKEAGKWWSKAADQGNNNTQIALSSSPKLKSLLLPSCVLLQQTAKAEKEKAEQLQGIIKKAKGKVIYKYDEMLITDGVRDVADFVNIWWLMAMIKGWQTDKIIKETCLLSQVWTLKINPDKSAEVSIQRGEGGPTLVLNQMTYSNFPLDTLTLWCRDNTLMLPGEYERYAAKKLKQRGPVESKWI